MKDGKSRLFLLSICWFLIVNINSTLCTPMSATGTHKHTLCYLEKVRFSPVIAYLLSPKCSLTAGKKRMYNLGSSESKCVMSCPAQSVDCKFQRILATQLKMYLFCYPEASWFWEIVFWAGRNLGHKENTKSSPLFQSA